MLGRPTRTARLFVRLGMLLGAVALLATLALPAHATHLSFTALEISSPQEPLADPNAGNNSCPAHMDQVADPANLPAETIAGVVVSGVVMRKPGDNTGAWRVGSDRICVYAPAGTRLDNEPRVGSQVRVIGVRAVDGGPILAERITKRADSAPNAPAEVEVAYLFNGTLIETRDVCHARFLTGPMGPWTIRDSAGHDHSFDVSNAEVEPIDVCATPLEQPTVTVEFLIGENAAP